MYSYFFWNKECNLGYLFDERNKRRKQTIDAT